jgi:hypothetical protein
MEYLRLFGVNGVVGRQGRSLCKIYASLLIGLLLTGCATTIASYKIDNIEKPPQMSFLEVIRAFRSLNKAVNTENGVVTGKIFSDGIIVTGNIYIAHSHIIQGGWKCPFGQVKQFYVEQYDGHTLLNYVGGNLNPLASLCLDTPDDAKRFVDTFIALNYYFSSRFLADDAVAFADFQKKSRAWRALPVKPALPDDLRRFRFAAIDALRNKKFQEAVEYYEQGLAIEPLWPRGQLLAAVWEGSMQWYGMAAMHMKRYLELNPYAKDSKAAFELSNKEEAVSLASAFNVLQRYGVAADEAEFADEAKRYREMPVKPTLPEDVQRARVAAEDAFNNKDFENAYWYYMEGLAIEPLWPQGLFNAALLEGELHWYNSAALHMKRYLLLVPDAANAKAAREKMYLWEVKAKETPSPPESMQESETSKKGKRKVVK